MYDKDNSGEKWHKIARYVGGKSVEEVRRHYDLLLKDITQIENGQVPLPNYDQNNARGYANEQRFDFRLIFKITNLTFYNRLHIIIHHVDRYSLINVIRFYFDYTLHNEIMFINELITLYMYIYGWLSIYIHT